MTESDATRDQLVAAALALDTAIERAAFLNQACENSPELRRAVEQILAERDSARPEAGGATVLEAGSSDDTPDNRSQTACATQSADRKECGGETSSIASRSSLHASPGDTIEQSPQIRLRDPSSAGDRSDLPQGSAGILERTADGRYELLGEIARGGMGAILKGRDTELGRELAVKVLLDSHRSKPAVIQRFIEEAQIAGQLQHPGIAPIYELGELDDHRPFFSMKLVRGETLSVLLARRTTVADDRNRFLVIFEQICQTMAYVHSRGVIHRDLKPANVMVGAFGEVQVMDWGLAKVLVPGSISSERPAELLHESVSITTRRSGNSSAGDGLSDPHSSHTQMGSVLGTPAYMPPEQAVGAVDQIDQRSDVFGLGAILCEILTGLPPYIGANGTEIFRLASRGKLDDCDRRLDQCGADPELIRLARRCLQVDPAQRPSDAGELARGVAEYLRSVDTRLKETEIQAAAQAARLDQQQRAAKNLRRMNAVLISVALTAMLAGVAALLARNEAARQARSAADNAQRALDSEGDAIAARNLVETEKENVVSALSRVTAALGQAETAEEQSRQLLYATDMQLLPFMLDDTQVTGLQVRNKLASHLPAGEPASAAKPDLRGFEWHYFQSALNGGAVQTELPGDVFDLAFASDGQLLTLDRQLDTAWIDPATGIRRDVATAIQTPPGARTGVVSADGRCIAFAVAREVVVARLEPQARSVVLPVNGVANELAIAHDGSFVATFDGQTVSWFEVDSQRRIYRAEASDVRGLALSGDGLTLAIWGRRNVGDGISLRRFEPTIAQVAAPGADLDFQETIGLTTLSSDGRLLAVGSHFGGRFQVFDTTTGDRVGSHPSAHASALSALEFSRDGARLVSADVEGTIKIWNSPASLTPTSSPGRVLRAHSDAVNLLRLDTSGDRLVSVGRDRSLRFWNLTATASNAAFNAPGGDDAAFFADGLLIAALSGNRVVILDATTGAPVSTLADGPEPLLALAVSPAGRHLAVGRMRKSVARPSVVELWDLVTHRQLAVFEGQEAGRLEHEAYSSAEALVFSPDGRFLIAGFGSRGKQFVGTPVPLKVWNVDHHAEVAQLHGHTNACVALAFSPDGSVLASGSHDETVRFWKTGTWESARPPLSLPAQSVEALAFAPDGSSLAIGTLSRQERNGAVFLWNIAADSLEPLPKAHANATQSVAFSPDGRTLATSSSDTTVRLWNVATRRSLLSLPGHDSTSDAVRALQFSPDGRLLLGAATQSNRTLLWRASEGLWRDIPGAAERFARLQDSPTTMQMVIRLLSANPSLLPVLEAVFAPEDRVSPAIAALRCAHHARNQDWNATSREFDRFQELAPGKLATWLGCPSLLQVANALYRGGRAADATRVLADGLPSRLEEYESSNAAELGLLTAVDQSLAHQPEDPVLGELRSELLGWLSDETGQIAEATRVIESLAGQNDRESAARRIRLTRRRAEARLRLKEWQTAVDDLDHVEAAGEIDAGLLASRAAALENLHNWERAAADRQRAAELAPEQAIDLAEFTLRLFDRGDRRLLIPALVQARNQLETRLQTNANQPELATVLARLLLSASADWETLTPSELQADQGTTLKLLEDGSILAVGPTPSTDQYRFLAGIPRAPIAAIRLEALTDASLPKTGPGRHVEGITVVERFEMRTATSAEPDRQEKVAWRFVHTDHHLPTEPPLPETGNWHLAFGRAQSHRLILKPETEVPVEDLAQLVFEMKFPDFTEFPALQLGRFRLSFSSDPRAFDREVLRIEASRQADPWIRLALAYRALPDQEACEAVLRRHPEIVDRVERVTRQGQLISTGDALRSRLMNIDSVDSMGILRDGALQVWLGMETEYSALCDLALAKVPVDGDLYDLDRVAKLCCLIRHQTPVRLRRALDLARSAVERGNGDALIRYLLMGQGIAEFRNGNLEDANRLLERAGNLGQSDPFVSQPARFYRALCLAQMGRDEQARSLAHSAALEMEPLPPADAPPLANGRTENHLIIWLAYQEARDVLGPEIDPSR